MKHVQNVIFNQLSSFTSLHHLCTRRAATQQKNHNTLTPLGLDHETFQCDYSASQKLFFFAKKSRKSRLCTTPHGSSPAKTGGSLPPLAWTEDMPYTCGDRMKNFESLFELLPKYFRDLYLCFQGVRYVENYQYLLVTPLFKRLWVDHFQIFTVKKKRYLKNAGKMMVCKIGSFAAITLFSGCKLALKKVSFHQKSRLFKIFLLNFVGNI